MREKPHVRLNDDRIPEQLITVQYIIFHKFGEQIFA